MSDERLIKTVVFSVMDWMEHLKEEDRQESGWLTSRTGGACVHDLNTSDGLAIDDSSRM